MERRIEQGFADRRAQQVLGFLIAKGLLVGGEIQPRGNAKLKIQDVLWVGRNVEPRVLEVFPAAVLHFPRSFLHTAQIPEELTAVINAIKAGERAGPDFEGMRYRDMQKWAEKKTSDRRTKPLAEIRVNKTFRLLPAAITALESRALKSGLTVTRYIETLLLQK